MNNSNYITEQELLEPQELYNKSDEALDPDSMGFDGKEGIDDED